MASTSYASWESIKPHVYNVIRGKKLPLSFKIVLVLSQPDIMDMLEKNHLTIPVSDVANLTLNVYYDGMSIQLTSWRPRTYSPWIRPLSMCGMRRSGIS